jgi:hypothetical protein
MVATWDCLCFPLFRYSRWTRAPLALFANPFTLRAYVERFEAKGGTKLNERAFGIVQLAQLRGGSRSHSFSAVRNARNNAALQKAEIAVPSSIP